MRDDAIEAGWQPTTDSETYSEHPRLEALAAVERRVRLGSSHDRDATLAPGRADDLREVFTLIRDYGPNWSLGIDTIEVHDRLIDLPHSWQNILEALKSAGVNITYAALTTKVKALTSVQTAED